ncbi:MAG: DUF362 domain-containing protein, partial [Deltaproteobacteria bacterium]|nr:DUF362 domain-containing protein [Deltaproteobacteria bacterium]
MEFTRRDFLKNSFFLGGSLLFSPLALQCSSSETAQKVSIGVARGIHPGRVVWVWDRYATNWEGYDSSEHWWEDSCTDLNRAREMISQAIHQVTGESTDAAAWDAIFKYCNNARGKGDIGYQKGEKIAVKINLTTCNAKSKEVDPVTHDKKPGMINNIDVAPQMVFSLLEQLVNEAGVDQEDISLGDPTAMIPNYYWDFLHPDFADVRYFDNHGGAGRIRSQFSDTPVHWSTPDAEGKLQDYLAMPFAEAEYIVNFALIKGHGAGFSNCGKNHFGSLIRCPDRYMRPADPNKDPDKGKHLNYLDLHLSLPWSVPGMGYYRAIVDLMAHPEVGGKTLLYLSDGLYSGYKWEAHPYKWKSYPFDDHWPSSLFASLDPVAIDSVAYDFLAQEWPQIVTPPGLKGGAKDYLIEAALAHDPPSGTFYDPTRAGNPAPSLGVYENWNNPMDKQYSRNLGTGDG